MTEDNADRLFTDAENVPTLADVIVPGDVLRRHDYRLPAQPDEKPARPAVAAPGDGERYLQERVAGGIRRIVSETMTRVTRDELHRRDPPM